MVSRFWTAAARLRSSRFFSRFEVPRAGSLNCQDVGELVLDGNALAKPGAFCTGGELTAQPDLKQFVLRDTNGFVPAGTSCTCRAACTSRRHRDRR